MLNYNVSSSTSPEILFEDAKQAAFTALDSCPVDVIRRFVNRSWRFMDAYRVPLSGKAAAWAVRKQKGHRTISQSAMMHSFPECDDAPGCRRPPNIGT